MNAGADMLRIGKELIALHSTSSLKIKWIP